VERPQCGKQRHGARAKQGKKCAARIFRLCFAPVRVVGSSPTWGAKEIRPPQGGLISFSSSTDLQPEG